VRQVSVLEWTRRLPFVPFVIQCSDGVRYEIRNPELVVATMSEVLLARPSSTADLPAVTLSYYHIVRIEPLGPATDVGRKHNGESNG
jgi:hypothetical protein